MNIYRKIGPVSIDASLTCKELYASIGNRYMTGKKVGIIVRAPRLHLGVFTNAQYGWAESEMRPHKYNIRLGS
jgi:hypothetical protein